ncbi:hypothetical protein ACHAWC_008692 [Mediolabrus comicus]
MAPINTTRTLFEVRVGQYHTVEVLLQIRQADLSWWNEDIRNNERQLHKLLGRRVLPVECREEIEKFHTRRRQREERKAAHNEATDSKKKHAVVVGEVNLKKKASSRKRGSGNNETKSRKKPKVANDKTAKKAAEDTTTKEKRSKLFSDPGTWVLAPGYTIQLCYRMEDIESSSATTLVFRTNKKSGVLKSETANANDGNDSNQGADTTTGEQTQNSLDEDDKKSVTLASFRRWTKLKKRINVWVFKFDPDNPCDLSHSEGGGFPRPDLLPMADIFRSTVRGDE